MSLWTLDGNVVRGPAGEQAFETPECAAAHVAKLEDALKRIVADAPAGANAPYKIQKKGGKWVVVNNAGMTKATFDGDDAGYQKALKYQRALYVNVPGAAKRADKVKFTGKAKDRVPAPEKSYVSQGRRDAAVKNGDAFPDGSFPISSQSELDKAWNLRGHNENHSEADIVSHIKKQAKKHGLTVPTANSEYNESTDTSGAVAAH